MAFWKRKKKRTTAKPKIIASISKVEKPKKISEKHDFVVHKEEHQVSLSPKPKMKNLPTFKPDRYEKEFMNIFRQLVSEKKQTVGYLERLYCYVGLFYIKFCGQISI